MSASELTNREEVINKTRKEDERSDLKQHADKMLRDFEKFNDFSSNRAIWELVQNACDLTKNCEITIDYRNDRIAFTHNGKPFDTKSLISLIKQVSGKYGDQEEITEVGKYGTGFLATHSFGRKFELDSVLHTGDYYLPIKKFEIDRTPKTWELLSDSIADQKRKVYELIANEDSIEKPDIFSTTFTYFPLSTNEFEYLNKSSADLDSYIPLVFTVNDRLKKISVIDRENRTTMFVFQKKERIENANDINLFQTIISKDNAEIYVYSIIDVVDEIEVILPINKNNQVFEFGERVARLFLYYPLIGSEHFGINFVINCKKFLPTEPRNGLHLNSDKEQVKEQEESNRRIIEKCTEIIFRFLNSNVIEVDNPLLYSSVQFQTNTDDKPLNDYFSGLQNDWNKKLQPLPFVKTLDGLKKIEDVIYFSEDFINPDDERLFDVFYELISKFHSNIPLKEDVKRWSRNALGWNNEKINFINQTDLVEKISECKFEDFNQSTLINYYKHLNELEKPYFTDYSLLPNIDGVFYKLAHFLSANNLSKKLIEIGKELIPDKMSQLINEDYKLDFTLNNFNQRNFTDEVKNKLDAIDFSSEVYVNDEETLESYENAKINSKSRSTKVFFTSLFELCKHSYTIDANNKSIQLVKLIAQYYQFDDNLIQLPSVSEDFEKVELRAIRKVLFRIFSNTVSCHNSVWVESSLEYLYKIHETYDDSNKDIFKESYLYPNQLFELCQSDSLKRDIDVNSEIKQFYYEVTNEDINYKLSIIEFNGFISEENGINNRYLTSIIEDRIFSTDINNIEEHPNKKTILKIIQKLTDLEYRTLFPQLNDKKASIMLSVVTKEETKDDIFSIVTLADDKLKSIGRLIRRRDFESIINKAISLIEEEYQPNANFEFKHKIGTHIEKILREHLKGIYTPEEIIYEVKDEQDGQDIVILIQDEIRYYIEVKSRWDKNTSIRMSKNQTIRAYEKQKIYSLCSVDMTNYHEADRFEVQDIKKIFSCIKFMTNIGAEVEHLIDTLKQTNEYDEIHLDGDYRTLVPQKIIDEEGISMNDFEKFLIDILSK
jgi:hypothetical protein